MHSPFYLFLHQKNLSQSDLRAAASAHLLLSSPLHPPLPLPLPLPSLPLSLPRFLRETFPLNRIHCSKSKVKDVERRLERLEWKIRRFFRSRCALTCVCLGEREEGRGRTYLNNLTFFKKSSSSSLPLSFSPLSFSPLQIAAVITDFHFEVFEERVKERRREKISG